MPALSHQQRYILRWLLKLTLNAEQHTPELLESGFLWALDVKNKERENCYRSSMSRTLKRLEGRELVKCVKGRKNARTIGVILTSEGRKVAEAITSYQPA